MIAYRRWFWWLLLVPIAVGVFRLRFDAEVMNLLPDEFPIVRGLKLYQTNFANARELILTVTASDSEAGETSARAIAERLRAATNLVNDVVWQPLWLEKPGQSAELVAYLWMNRPPHEFAAAAERLRGTNLQAVVREAREALTTSLSPFDLARRGYDPLGLTEVPSAGANTFDDGSELFASTDGRFRILFVKAAGDISDYRNCTKWLNEVRATVNLALQDLPAESRAVIRYTGRPAFVSEISTGMQQDIAGPSGATLAVIAALFFFMHRRIKPLLWLTLLLLVILAGTAALGGLVFGTINVISLGFASILLGLAEDFGVVLYQESRSHPRLSAREVRRLAAPGIFWSAVTTCSAFLALNFGGLPGLGQLGTLVAIGIALAAVVMLFGYLPPLMPQRDASLSSGIGAQSGSPVANRQHVEARAPRLIGWLTLALICAAGAVLFIKRPAFDNSPDALRPKKSEAFAAAEEIKTRLRRTQEPLWLLATGRDDAEILRRLKTAEAALTNAMAQGLVSDFMLPLGFWPNPLAQASNKVVAAQLIQRRDELREAIVQGGFTSDAFALTDSILSTWQSAQTQPVFWPTNDNSRWILEKFIARTNTQLLALGLVNRNTNASLAELTPKLLTLADELARDAVYLSGWEILGHALFVRVRGDFWKILVPMTALVLISLWCAYRDLRDVLLSLITLAVTGVLLWATMAVLGWTWNLLNLMAIPLLLGMGVDFSIHVQLALRRTNGDLAEVRGSIGRALLLAGSTTVAGFASLAFSNNAGLASLGKVCAVGIVCAMLVSVYRLPHWWKLWHRSRV